MGMLRTEFDSKYNDLLSQTLDRINDYFENLSSYPNHQSDWDDTISTYNGFFSNILLPSINNFFTKDAEINELYKNFIMQYFNGKGLYKINLPDTDNIYDLFNFNFIDKYKLDICDDFFSATTNDVWGGVKYTPPPPGGQTEEPSDVNITALAGNIDNMKDIEISMFDSISSTITSAAGNIVLKVHYMLDDGDPIPQRTIQFPKFRDYLQDPNVNMLDIIQDFNLTLLLPDGL